METEEGKVFRQRKLPEEGRGSEWRGQEPREGGVLRVAQSEGAE